MDIAPQCTVSSLFQQRVFFSLIKRPVGGLPAAAAWWTFGAHRDPVILVAFPQPATNKYFNRSEWHFCAFILQFFAPIFIFLVVCLSLFLFCHAQAWWGWPVALYPTQPPCAPWLLSWHAAHRLFLIIWCMTSCPHVHRQLKLDAHWGCGEPTRK